MRHDDVRFGDVARHGVVVGGIEVQVRYCDDGDPRSLRNPGKSDGKKLVAVATGFSGYCAGEPAVKMGDAVQSAGQSAQGAAQASN